MTEQALPPATEAGNLWCTNREFIDLLAEEGPGCVTNWYRRRDEAMATEGGRLEWLIGRHLFCENTYTTWFTMEDACLGCFECTAGEAPLEEGGFCYGGEWCHDEKGHPAGEQARRFEELNVAYPNVYRHFLANARHHRNAGFKVPAGALLRKVAPSVTVWREHALYCAALAVADDANLSDVFDLRDAQGADRNVVAAWAGHQIEWRKSLGRPRKPSAWDEPETAILGADLRGKLEAACRPCRARQMAPLSSSRY